MNVLTGIAWHGYSVPFRKRFVNSSGTADIRTGLLVFLRTNSGFTGTGEASPVGTGTPDEVQGIIGELGKIAPRLLGLPLEMVERLIFEGLPGALAFGLDTALRDIKAREAGVPLTKLLGGRPQPITVNALLTADSPEQAAAEASAAIESGFECVKLKVGKNVLQHDEAVIAAVRAAVGPGVHIRVDANGAWSVEQAIEAISAISRYGIEYVEQPVAAADVEGMARVRNSSRIPLGADESLGSYPDLHRLLEAGAADIFIIKCARLGVFRKTQHIANEIIERGHRVVVTSSLESGVGIAAAAHLAAALPPQMKAHGLATASLLETDLLDTPWYPEEGRLSVPNVPGLGFKVDPALLVRYSSGVIGSAGSRTGLETYLAIARS